MASCPKCGGVVKEWDLVCPGCGTTIFKPHAPVDEKKVSVDLPDWEMKPRKPEPPRVTPPPRPDPRKPVPARAPEARRIQVPELPRPPLTPGYEEPTEVLDASDLAPVDEEPVRPDTSTAPAPSPEPAPPARPTAPTDPAPPGGKLERRQRQDTVPISRAEEEVTQPRAKVPVPATPPRDERTEELVRRADAKQTLHLDNYDPERLKRILAQAQAEAASRSPSRPGIPLSVIIALIAAATIIGVALVIALLA